MPNAKNEDGIARRAHSAAAFFAFLCQFCSSPACLVVLQGCESGGLLSSSVDDVAHSVVGG